VTNSGLLSSLDSPRNTRRQEIPNLQVFIAMKARWRFDGKLNDQYDDISKTGTFDNPTAHGWLGLNKYWLVSLIQSEARPSVKAQEDTLGQPISSQSSASCAGKKH
jgi:hypothetical protein